MLLLAPATWTAIDAGSKLVPCWKFDSPRLPELQPSSFVEHEVPDRYQQISVAIANACAAPEDSLEPSYSDHIISAAITSAVVTCSKADYAVTSLNVRYPSYFFAAAFFAAQRFFAAAEIAALPAALNLRLALEALGASAFD